MALGRRQRNGEQANEYERQRRFEREQQREQRALQQAFNQQGELDRGWMRDILDTEDLEEHLQRQTLTKVRELLNKETILANFTDAQAHDRWWELEVMKLKILGEHPPGESAIQGPLRAFLFDDETEGLWALTAAERNAINRLISALQNRTTRGRGGFERKQINTNIARTESEKAGNEQKKSRIAGLFG